jgi:hypothetical protein
MKKFLFVVVFAVACSDDAPTSPDQDMGTDTFRAGLGDARIDVIIPQAPALIPLFAEGAIAGITLPTMLQSGRMDQTLPNAVHAVPLMSSLPDRPLRSVHTPFASP